MSRNILHVVTNVDSYDDPDHPTGLWLSELVHAWDVFDVEGYRQTIISPRGGKVPLEPRSLKFPNFDRAARAWHGDPDRMALLDDTRGPGDIDPADFDAIYFTGGHAVMYDFPDDPGLQRITRQIWESGGVVSAVCHGYCGLLNTTLTDGSLLVSGRRLTGFSWREEVLARVAKLVPFDVEAQMKERGAHYTRARLPFGAYAVTDGRLVTGQNPRSATKTARAVVATLREPTD